MYWENWSFGKERMLSSIELLERRPKKRNFFTYYCCWSKIPNN